MPDKFWLKIDLITATGKLIFTFGLRMYLQLLPAYDYLFSPPSVWYNQRVGVSMCTLVTKRIGGNGWTWKMKGVMNLDRTSILLHLTIYHRFLCNLVLIWCVHILVVLCAILHTLKNHENIILFLKILS